jgi:hypothetical protein
MKAPLHFRRSIVARLRSHDHGPAWADTAVIGLRLAGWLAVTSLASAGVISLAAFALGSFSLPQTMLQLANLATRYVAADGSRQDQFNRIVEWGFWGSFLTIAFFRRASLARVFDIAPERESRVFAAALKEDSQ